MEIVLCCQSGQGFQTPFIVKATTGGESPLCQLHRQEAAPPNTHGDRPLPQPLQRWGTEAQRSDVFCQSLPSAFHHLFSRHLLYARHTPGTQQVRSRPGMIRDPNSDQSHTKPTLAFRIGSRLLFVECTNSCKVCIAWGSPDETSQAAWGSPGPFNSSYPRDGLLL